MTSSVRGSDGLPSGAGEEVVPRLERHLTDLNGRRRIQRLHAERHVLVIRAAVTGRLKAETLELTGDVLGALHRLGTPRHASAHAVVGEAVDARHEVRDRDRRRGFGRIELEWKRLR
jgi:hypothetical protein